MASIDKAYVVDAGGIYHAIENGVARVSSVTSANINVWVGENAAGAPALVAALTGVLGAAPTSIVLDVSTRFAHSHEIGRTAVGDETINLPPVASMGLPISLSSASPSVLETIFVRTTGNDANDGTTVGTAILTIQEACDRIMVQSPLSHSVLVDIGPGTFGDPWQLSGVECRNGSNIYWIGNAPTAVATDKTSLSAGAATLTATRDWMAGTRLRWTGDAAWGGGGVPGVNADIGRTVSFDDSNGGHHMYGTVANVGTGPALATQYVDIIANPAILGVAPVPAWLAVGGVVPAGVTFRILDHTDAIQVTQITGDVYVGGLHSTAGVAQQPSDATAKHNLFGHLRFNTGTVSFEDADRIAFHGTRFETSATFTDCRDCTSNAVTVPTAALFRFWPTAIWTRLGYSHSSSNDVYGGAGFLVATALNFTRCTGTWSGLVTAPNTSVSITDNSNMTFVGISHASTQPIDVQTNSYATCSYMRSAGRVNTSGRAMSIVQDYVSFLAAGVATDDTVANAPVNFGAGMLNATVNGNSYIILGAATRLEGRNSQGAAQPGGGRVAVSVDSGGTVSIIGATDGDFYGDGGWLNARQNATVNATGDRVFPSKVATDATLDIRIAQGTKVRSTGNWAHALVDTTPGMLVHVVDRSEWIHGDPAVNGGGTSIYTIGDGAGAGIDCGQGPAILVDSNSYICLGKARVWNSNNNGASRALAMLHASHGKVGSGNGANDSYLESTSGGNEVTYGDGATASANPIIAGFLSDIASAGNPQGCTYEIV